MMAQRLSPNNFDEYIAGFPVSTRIILEQVRAVIKASAPDATEAIKYGIPTFVLRGNLVHFGAFKSHIGFYPTPSGILKFKKELSNFTTAKGSVQFLLSQPMPLALITKMVQFRVKEALGKTPGAKNPKGAH